MSKGTELLCTCELENGYIFRNFFAFVSVRNRPVVTFMHDRIAAANRTADDELYGAGYLHGDEIKLTWNSAVPEDKRSISLVLDGALLQSILGKIKKKEQARLSIACAFETQPWYETATDYTMYVSYGAGGDGREGIKGVQATRVDPDKMVLKCPSTPSLLVIPIRHFKAMVDSFAKCKKEKITIRLYRQGLVMTTDTAMHTIPIFEKYGEVPDDSHDAIGHNIDESTIVHSSGTLEIEKIPEPNEYTFKADKISIFGKLASVHNEGSVRVYYEEGKHLRIAYRFGAFGECEICLYNSYT